MPPLSFRTPDGFRFRRRGIGFLEGEPWLDARKIFDGLSSAGKEDMRNRIDHWLQGGIHDKYHHGFPNDAAHDQCYVFKHQSLRIYGFLCNPKPKTDPGFRLCVLTQAALKHQWKTEMTYLDNAMAMLKDQRAVAAIADPKKPPKYPEYGKGPKQWKN